MSDNNYPIKGKEGTRKVIVASHERSGTHFLMNTLAYNFGYVSDPWIDIDIEQVINPFAASNIADFLNHFFGEPILNTFKTHFPAEFFLPILNTLLDDYQVFYIHRNGAETMNSFAKHLNAYDWYAGPKVRDGMELATAEPSGYLMRYQWGQIPDMHARWKAHVKGWMLLPEKYRDRIIYVKFEELNLRFENTVKEIAKALGRPPVKNITRPSKYEHVITPEG